MVNNLLSTLSRQELEILKQGGQHLRHYQSELFEQLTKILNSLMFHNAHTLHPSKLRDIAAEETDTFIKFLSTDDVGSIDERGKKLAELGMGYQSLLSICTCFTDICIDKLGAKNPELLKLALKATQTYANSVFEGYIQGFKMQLIKDLSQTRQALNTVRQQQQK
ncbi:hypothetical protein JXJ21_19275 [candidate division KSB1 bacterium]|nr:hypothetical protein [candidate division KSB1 bacterium]